MGESALIITTRNDAYRWSYVFRKMATIPLVRQVSVCARADLRTDRFFFEREEGTDSSTQTLASRAGPGSKFPSEARLESMKEAQNVLNLTFSEK